jgi:murein DD-endopeptidase MepM/ murein hydrolase activator NlpD
MSHFGVVYYSRFAFRLALTGLAAAMLAGCANSERLSDPFGSPFQNSAVTDPAPTASTVPSAPLTPVQSRPLAAPTSSLAPPAAPQSPRTAASSTRQSAAVAGWSAEGGTPISVAQGETADVLSKRYGIPADALLKANGLTSAAQVRPGARVIIPVYNVNGAPRATASAAPASSARTIAEAHAEKIKLLKGKSPSNAAVADKSAAAAQKVAPAKDQSKKLAAASKPEAVATQPIKTAALTKQDVAKVKAEGAVVETKKPELQESAPAEAAKAGADSANPEFRWPARGRIIQGFKAGGNDGINIAVPEGTSVKAAESGVVAYAGSELKGYGNLILIRHPNGFVSAYANNGDIEVKRGETVKRGQVIAKSGQSGNVATPQLHFELRKGATPVDPTLYLAGL